MQVGSVLRFMKILTKFKYVLHGFYWSNCFKTSVAIQARLQLCTYKFCLRSSDCKGLKTLSLCMHVNCIPLAFSEHGTSEISTKIFNFLVSEHESHYAKVSYALLLMSEIIRNIKESVCDTQTILIHV